MPMISSVQNIQSSIKNAPDNVIGMVKGLSDNVVDSINKSISVASPQATQTPGTASNSNSSSSFSSLNAANTQSANSSGSGGSGASFGGKSKINSATIDRTLLNNDDIVTLYVKLSFDKTLRMI
jgi:hypothetical protein